MAERKLAVRHFSETIFTNVFPSKPYKYPTLRHFNKEGRRGAWESLCFQDGCSLTTCPSSERMDKRVAALPTYSLILSKRCWNVKHQEKCSWKCMKLTRKLNSTASSPPSHISTKGWAGKCPHCKGEGSVCPSQHATYISEQSPLHLAWENSCNVWKRIP